MTKWKDYTERRDEMLQHTHSPHAPWIIIRGNDKRRARIEVIRRILLALPYKGRDLNVIGDADPKIIGEGPEFLARGKNVDA